MSRFRSTTFPCAVTSVLFLPLVASGQLGVPVTYPEALNTNAASDSGADHRPQATTDGAGNWVVVWQSTADLGGTIGTDWDILVSRSVDNGLNWSAPQALNGNADSDSGDDYVPQVTTDGAGNWVVVWHSDQNLGGTIGTDFDILAARSTDNGATWSAPQALNINADSDSGGDRLPQGTTDGVGNWVVLWYSYEDLGGTIGTDADILVASSTDNGATWSAPEALNTNAGTDSGDDFGRQVTTDEAGIWLALWYSDDDLGGTIGTDFDILVARSTDSGSTWSAPEPLNTNATSDTGGDYYPQWTTDGAGNWVAVWASDDDLGGTVGTDRDILLARSTDNGASWSTPQALNAYAATDSGDDYFPQATTDGAGNWVAVWVSDDDLGATIDTDLDILVARSTDNGATWSAPQPLNANAASDSGADNNPHVTTDGAGNWLVMWRSYDDLGGTIGTDGDILVARFALPDCNVNGVADAQDIAGGTSADCDANGVPDECQPDTDGDGTIDACEGPCGCGATSAILMSFWALGAVKLARRRRVRAEIARR